MFNLKNFVGPHPTEICSIVGNYPADLATLKEEDVINLERCILDPVIAQAEIGFCDSYLNTSQGLLERMIVEIKKEAFFFLFEKASDLRNGSERYVTALKIHFGLSGNKICPVFQPIYMKKTGNSTSGDITYDAQCENYYVYEEQNGRFVPAGTNEMEKITAYQNPVSGIQIKHFSETVFDDFRPNEDPKSLTFPFQTIFQLMDDNPRSKTILLYNAIRTEGADINHCILLAPIPAPFTRSIGDEYFQNSYANRSHLCPPCTSVEFNINKLGPTPCP